MKRFLDYIKESRGYTATVHGVYTKSSDGHYHRVGDTHYNKDFAKDAADAHTHNTGKKHHVKSFHTPLHMMFHGGDPKYGHTKAPKKFKYKAGVVNVSESSTIKFDDIELFEHNFEVGSKVTIKSSGETGKVVKIDNYGTEDEVYHVNVDGKVSKFEPDSLSESVEPKHNMSRCLKFAKQSLAEEEQAVKDYTDRIKKCTDEGLKKILSHALEEEKHHTKMIRDWINKVSGE